MKTFFHPDQKLHHPQTYFSRGMMRKPQEVPSRLDALAEGVRKLGFELVEPADAGAAPISAVHALDYLRFLQEAHGRWKQLPDDWGDEVVSNIFVREPNALRGVLAQADAALVWATDELAGQALDLGEGSARLTRTDLPQDLLRRLLLRMIAHVNPGAENPRGPSLDQALVQLSHGRTITMADCVISSGAAWIVRRAPPRKAR